MMNITEVRFIMLSKPIRNKVASLLTKYEKTRDSDDYLVALYWYEELKAVNIAMNLTALQLLEEISKGKLTNFDTITRCRRKIQEENVSLRGDKYQNRKHKLVKDTIEQLNDGYWGYNV